MITHAHRKAILSALHQGRKDQGLTDATLREDAAAMKQVRSVARSFFLPGTDAAAHRKKLLADLSKALAKANASLDEARNCSDAMAALRTIAPEDRDGDAVASDLSTFADGLRAFAELFARASRLSARRTKIECLIEFFTPAYKRHSGAAPSVRRHVGGHEKSGKAYGPYLDYICAIGAALDVGCSPEGVATALKRMDDEGKDWLRQPYRPAEERFRGYLETIRVVD